MRSVSESVADPVWTVDGAQDEESRYRMRYGDQPVGRVVRQLVELPDGTRQWMRRWVPVAGPSEDGRTYWPGILDTPRVMGKAMALVRGWEFRRLMRALGRDVAPLATQEEQEV